MTPSKYDYTLHYREFHDDSEPHAAAMIQTYMRHLSPLLPTPDSAAVLDIGCGMGFALLALTEMGFSDVSGIDIDSGQVLSCHSRGLNVRQVDDAVSYLDQHPGHFRVVLLLDVLEHIPAPGQIPLMRAVYRSLAPNGRVVLQVPNASSILASRWRYIDHTHHGSFTEYSLRFVLRNAGFRSVDFRPDRKLPTRPSVRLWRPNIRTKFRKWVVRYFWRQVLLAELGDKTTVDHISLELNLMAYAVKSEAPRQ